MSLFISQRESLDGPSAVAKAPGCAAREVKQQKEAGVGAVRTWGPLHIVDVVVGVLKGVNNLFVLQKWRLKSFNFLPRGILPANSKV
jgi:hypothetical protein